MHTMTLEQIAAAIRKMKNTLPGMGKILCKSIDRDRFGPTPEGVTIEPCTFLALGTAAIIDTEGYWMGTINIRANEVLVVSDEYRRRMRRVMSMELPKPEATT